MKIKRTLLICFLIIFITSGCTNIFKKQQEIANEKKIPVRVETVKKGTIINDVVYAGKVEPNKQVAVVSKIPGKVKKVYFDIGDKITKDDVLFTIDDEDIINNINILNAQLQSAQANVDIARSSLESSKGSQLQNQLNQSEANLKQAEITYNDAKDNFEDMQKLYDTGSISKQQYNQAKSAYEKAKVGYDSAKKSHDLLVNKISGENIKSAQDRLKQAEASKENIVLQLEDAKKSLEDTKVKSPINGIISNRTIDEGDMIGSTSVPFTVVDMDSVVINVSVSEQVINRINKGETVNVHIKSASEEPFTGQITAFSPAADERALTYPVKIELPNNDGVLKPGMFCEVNFPIEKSEDTVVISRSAVITEEDEDCVYISEDGVAKKIKVTTGIDNGKNIEITKGLNAGDILIIKGQNYVKDGEKIEIVKE